MSFDANSLHVSWIDEMDCIPACPLLSLTSQWLESAIGQFYLSVPRTRYKVRKINTLEGQYMQVFKVV